MQSVFLSVLGMSLVASLVILAVILVRLLLKKAPKIFSYVLWAVVLFRLLCPFSFESILSVIPKEIQMIPQRSAVEDYQRVPALSALDGALEAIGGAPNRGIGPYVPGEYGKLDGSARASHGEVRLLFLGCLWLAGVAAMALYGAVSYFKLRRKLIGSVSLRDNIYLADHITSPFVMGLLRPKIYLPSSLSEREQEYIILHEQYHIRRLDHVVKALAFAVLCIHWFNPLVWLAFLLSGKDMEMSCDEAVVKKMGEGIRADYSASLLNLATGRRVIAGTPLAFGEGDTGKRIENLARWKKPARWIIVAAAAVVVLMVVVCGTNSRVKPDLEIAALGNGVEVTCNFKESTCSWAIYEDIYWQGELVSSDVCLMDSVQEYGGPSGWNKTIQLNFAPVYSEGAFSGSLQCTCNDNGIRVNWEVDLPRDHYTGMGSMLKEGTADSCVRQDLQADDSALLYSILLSTKTNGGVAFKDRNGIIGANDTVVQYRLVTSTEGTDSFLS